MTMQICGCTQGKGSNNISRMSYFLAKFKSKTHLKHCSPRHKDADENQDSHSGVVGDLGLICHTTAACQCLHAPFATEQVVPSQKI